MGDWPWEIPFTLWLWVSIYGGVSRCQNNERIVNDFEWVDGFRKLSVWNVKTVDCV